MKRIPLSDGSFALVDDVDFEVVSLYRWYAERVGRMTCARSSDRGGIFMHRLIMGRMIGGQVLFHEIDHKDRIGRNNTRSNLRVATSQQNNWNRAKRLDKKLTSRFKGVIWEASRGKWRADIRVDGRTKTLGRFENEVDAAKAYDEAAMIIQGEFAWLNFGRKR